MNAISRESIRQQRETFEQLKRQDRVGFTLRLAMGYCALVLLPAVVMVCGIVLFTSGAFPRFVVMAASGTLFVDVVGWALAVWKFALAPTFQTRLRPVTDSGATRDGDGQR